MFSPAKLVLFIASSGKPPDHALTCTGLSTIKETKNLSQCLTFMLQKKKKEKKRCAYDYVLWVGHTHRRGGHAFASSTPGKCLAA